MHDEVATHESKSSEARRIEQLENDNASLRQELNDSRAAYARLQKTYTRTLEQLQLLRRRLFVAKAERTPDNADQLAFDKLLEEVKVLEAALDAAKAEAMPSDEAKGGKSTDDDKSGKKKRDNKPKGRRSEADMASLPKVRVEITDPELEGKVERIGFEPTYRLGYERGGMRCIEVALAVYRLPPAPKKDDETAASPSEPTAPKEVEDDEAVDDAKRDAALWRFVKAELPPELFRRGLLAPSMIAHVLTEKYMMGVPFYRLEKRLALQGASLDRGTMSRYAEDAGATLGCIVEAARKEALETAFCLSTDATGVSIQPEPLDDGKRQSCRKGHFFVVLADRDHVFFEYQEKHTSAVVSAMFRGFSGYIQADAHAVYDALYRPRPTKSGEDETATGPPPTEVGCWSHCRRKFWEAAVCKHELGVDGLRRIDALFAIEHRLKDLPPSKKKARRDTLLRPHIDAFFAWVKAEYDKARERGLVRSALGYAVRQETALRRFLDDGRLVMTNNASERALRSIAVGRKNWLFCGSDDHASAAANLFSLVASCKLHELDPEAYLADVLRVLAEWPRDRYLELAPKYWARTRARLDANELAKPVGRITVPPPLPA